MAYTKDARVRDLETYGKKHGFKQVILIAINHDAQDIIGVSWGLTPNLCERTKELKDVAFDAVYKKLS